ncbi:MAG: SAM-dependent methyltransferase [Aquificaceae bacterium]|nr:SAM-dependent methyltransferase [Aquificaceae bacterium]MDW8236917.1 SAM-dependent methyltransferase [Aquificaceae bacterium]
MQNNAKNYYSYRDFRRDFFTAPELDSAFGKAIALLIRELFKDKNSFDILEAGAGSGALARDLLLELKDLKVSYKILETSPYLKSLQKLALKDFDCVSWIETLEPFSGIFIANEFFDALCVHVIRDGFEVFVNSDGYEYHPISQEVQNYLQRMSYDLKDAELCLECEEFLNSLSSAQKEGYILIIDYGNLNPPSFTLRAYSSHKVFDPLKVKPSDLFSADITADVDFLAIKKIAASLGYREIFFKTLWEFLSLNEAFESEYLKAFESKDFERISRLKTMLVSMGNSFKVLLLQKSFSSTS